MPPESRDAAYLWDILDAAHTVRRFTAGISREEYRQNRMMQLAVERCVETIGEAARRISKEFRSAHSEIPWQQIIAQRNVLAHEYGAINQDRLWALATRHIPDLIAKLEPLAPPAPPVDGG